MSLSEIEIVSEKIEYGGSYLELRPLALWQTCRLLTSHASTLMPALAEVQSVGERGEVDRATHLLLKGVADNRALIVDLITHSAGGDLEDRQKVSSLPSYVQIAALLAVLRLSWGLDLTPFLNSISPGSNIIPFSIVAPTTRTEH